MRDIVVGVDGSAAAQRALDRALRLARIEGRRTRVVHAWQPSEVAPEQALRLLNSAISIASASAGCAPVVPELLEGPAPAVLARVAGEAAAVVLGISVKGTAAPVLGAVVPRVLHSAPCPVLVVPDNTSLVGRFPRVVVGFDGSPSSRAALRWALDVALGDRARVLVIRASEDNHSPSVWAQGSRAVSSSDLWDEVLTCEPRAAVMDVEVRVARGHADEVLHSALRPDDLLVVGSRGLGGFAGMMLGSVSAYCVSHPIAAVAVVRADAARIGRTASGDGKAARV